jgi:hypothetical protein
MPRSQRKHLIYNDDKGNTLYGFSQENLEKTNRELKRTNTYLMVLTILVIVMLGIFVASLIWADINNVITAMVYR